jgi:hypothetical protein
MTTDKLREPLVAALKQALAEPGEQRLYRSGKLSGLFPGRTGASGEAAATALRDGLFELVRRETKGKAEVEWVKLTPKGVEYLHAHESPRAVLEELHATLQVTQAGVPAWLETMQSDLHALNAKLTEDAAKILHRLDALSRRVEEALRRADAAGPAVEDGVSLAVPWAVDALAYLDRRRASGAAGDCPLPELFAALHDRHPGLSLTDYHLGLRRLSDYRALKLLPFVGGAGQLPEPEYALPDGAAFLYYAAR